MRNLYLLLVLSISSPSICQSVWSHLPNAPVPLNNTSTIAGRFDDMYFVNDSIGWIFGGWGGKIYKTMDRGNSWSLQAQGLNSRSIEFFNADTGFAGNLYGGLYKTYNGGAQWELIGDSLFSTYGFCGMSHFGNSLFVSGRYYGPAKFFRSNDFGNSWTENNLDSLASGLVDCHFFNTQEGLISGKSNFPSEGGIILKTMDGGIHWQKVAITGNSGSSYNYVWKFYFISDSVGMASVEDTINGKQIFLKTLDRGNSWHQQIMNGIYPFHIQGICFANDSLGWVGGWGSGIFETRDGGQYWNYLPYGGNFNRFFKTPSGEIYASGISIYKLETNFTSISDINIDVKNIHQLFPPSPNPCNKSTEIRFEVGVNTVITLQLISISDQKITLLQSGFVEKGSYSYILNTASFPSGIYFVLMLTDEDHYSTKFSITH